MVSRDRLVGVLFTVAFIMLVARLFWWQVIKASELGKSAQSQYSDQRRIHAGRGDILAQDLTWLAGSNEVWLVYADLPNIKESPRRVANQLAPFFIEDEHDRTKLLSESSRIEGLLARDDVVWLALKHKVGREVKEKIEQLNISGIGFEKQEERTYPEASSAAQLLGFVGKDENGEDQGYFGLEGYYNLPLSGKPGFLEQEKDARGIPIVFGQSREVSAVGGVDLVTHIDKTVQMTIEEKLANGLEKYGALQGTVIVMRPQDGAILGMSSYPSYDPRSYQDYTDDLFKNPAVSDSFEPGSIFKVLVMAAALDSGVVEPDTICDICDKPVKVDKYWIRTWNDKYRANSTMTDVIVHSDNVGMTFVAQKLGSDRLYDYLYSFGIGRQTGIDLQGEFNPGLRERGKWNVVDLATASFGQGIAVTPIQILRAVSAIANDGVLVTPQVVDKIKIEGWEQDIKPVRGSRVISKESAQDITAMMVEAASRGEARWTALRGFEVAGKTGTAQVPVEGHYDEDKTIASFIGFAPADDPKFIMLVTLKEPQSSPWGSGTAAPLWFDIAKDLFPYFKIQPKN